MDEERQEITVTVPEMLQRMAAATVHPASPFGRGLLLGMNILPGADESSGYVVDAPIEDINKFLAEQGYAQSRSSAERAGAHGRTVLDLFEEDLARAPGAPPPARTVRTTPSSAARASAELVALFESDLTGAPRAKPSQQPRASAATATPAKDLVDVFADDIPKKTG